MTIGGEGGVRRLMEKTILNFHFDCLIISLREDVGLKNLNLKPRPRAEMFLPFPYNDL